MNRARETHTGIKRQGGLGNGVHDLDTAPLTSRCPTKSPPT